MLSYRLFYSFHAAAAAAILLAPQVPWSSLLAREPEPGIREDLIAEVSPDVASDEWELITTRDGDQIAWREKRAGKYISVLNGKPCGVPYDEVSSLQFSTDGKRFSFSARKGKEWTAVVDCSEQPGLYQKISVVQFSPDGSRFEFLAKAKDGYSHVVDGKEGARYKEVSAAEFSPDSRHIVYCAQKGKQWLVVEDGVEGPSFDDVGRPRYTPLGGRLVYVVKRGKAEFLIDGRKEQQLREVKSGHRLLGFAPQTNEPLLAAYDGDNSRMLIGGVEGPLGHMRLMPVRCSDGCRHSVYATAYIRSRSFGSEHAYGQVVVNGKPGREYESAPPESAGKALLRAMGGSQVRFQPGSYSEFSPRLHGVSTPAISSDYEHVAYAARRGVGDFTVVTDGTEGPQMDAIPCNPSYSPGGKLYYVGVKNGVAVLVVDGKTAMELPLSTPGWDDKGACVGPDIAEGEHYAFGIVQKDGMRLVADGSEFKLRVMTAIAGPVTQVDGRRFHFAYTVRPDLTKPASLLIVDGKETRTYDDIWPGTVRWTEAGVVTYVARQGQKLLQVRHTMP